MARTKLLTTAEAAALLGLSLGNFWNYRNREGGILSWLIPEKREGATLLYRASDIRVAQRQVNKARKQGVTY